MVTNDAPHLELQNHSSLLWITIHIRLSKVIQLRKIDQILWLAHPDQSIYLALVKIFINKKFDYNQISTKAEFAIK